MKNGILTLNLKNLKGALVSGVLMAILSSSTYVIGIGDIFAVESKVLVNVAVISFLTAVVSLIKSLLTDDSGAFAGAIEVTNPK